jgi:hypothetical protein
MRSVFFFRRLNLIDTDMSKALFQLKFCWLFFRQMDDLSVYQLAAVVFIKY